jgi:hypothetical protein
MSGTSSLEIQDIIRYLVHDTVYPDIGIGDSAEVHLFTRNKACLKGNREKDASINHQFLNLQGIGSELASRLACLA